MNSILLTTGRTQARRLISNGSYLRSLKQRKQFSSNSSKSNQQTNQQPKQQSNQQAANQTVQQSSSSRTVTYASIAIGSLLSGYLLYNSLGGKSKSKITPPPTDDKQPPKQIDDLPEQIEYLIIGGGSAAFSALRSIRANQPLSKVIVVSEENDYPYMKPPLSKELWFAEPELRKEHKFRQWNDKERSLYYAHEEFYFNLKQLNESQTGGVTVLRGSKVVKLDPYDQYVILDNGQTLNYGKCLIATGSKSITSDLEKNASDDVRKRIVKFGRIADFSRLDKLVEQNKSIVLVGSEFLASELACALSKRSKGDVIQVMESKGSLTTILPEFLSEWTSKCLKEEGIKQLTSTQVKSTEFKNNQVVLHLSNGEQIKTDYLIIDNGAQPNTELARTSGLEICPLTGGLVANAELQIRTNLWAAGDVVSFYDEKLGRRRNPHHDNALVTGRLAGDNMSGGHKVFWHQPIIWSDLGPKIGLEAVGLIDSTLPTISVFTKPEKQQQQDDASNKESNPANELAVKLPNKSDDYYKGVVFYIKEGIVVGVLLWNVFSKTSLARRVISENKSYEDLSELAKLFELHKPEFENIDEQN